MAHSLYSYYNQRSIPQKSWCVVAWWKVCGAPTLTCLDVPSPVAACTAGREGLSSQRSPLSSAPVPGASSVAAGCWAHPEGEATTLLTVHSHKLQNANNSRGVFITGGWRHLNWGGRVRGNDWSGIGGMVSNTWFPGVWCHSICSFPAVILSRPPLSSLHWCSCTVADVWRDTMTLYYTYAHTTFPSSKKPIILL
jgi:hypothetical protein